MIDEAAALRAAKEDFTASIDDVRAHLTPPALARRARKIAQKTKTDVLNKASAHKGLLAGVTAGIALALVAKPLTQILLTRFKEKSNDK